MPLIPQESVDFPKAAMLLVQAAPWQDVWLCSWQPSTVLGQSHNPTQGSKHCHHSVNVTTGYQCEPYNNPADFFLDIINGDSTAVAMNKADGSNTGMKPIAESSYPNLCGNGNLKNCFGNSQHTEGASLSSRQTSWNPAETEMINQDNCSC